MVNSTYGAKTYTLAIKDPVITAKIPFLKNKANNSTEELFGTCAIIFDNVQKTCV
jgi:hypothetical protein